MHKGSARTFTWTVQTYGRDLGFSNVFFFPRLDEVTRITLTYLELLQYIKGENLHPMLRFLLRSPHRPSLKIMAQNRRSQVSITVKIALGVGLSMGIIFLAIACFAAHKFL